MSVPCTRMLPLRKVNCAVVVVLHFSIDMGPLVILDKHCWEGLRLRNKEADVEVNNVPSHCCRMSDVLHSSNTTEGCSEETSQLRIVLGVDICAWYAALYSFAGAGCPHSHPTGSYHFSCAGNRMDILSGMLSKCNCNKTTFASKPIRMDEVTFVEGVVAFLTISKGRHR